MYDPAHSGVDELYGLLVPSRFLVSQASPSVLHHHHTKRGSGDSLHNFLSSRDGDAIHPVLQIRGAGLRDYKILGLLCDM
jgi:hypothetical protein